MNPMPLRYCLKDGLLNAPFDGSRSGADPCKDCGQKPNISLQSVSLDFRVFFEKEFANRFFQ